MTSSHTISDSRSYSEAEIKEVLGKVYDDFHAIDARGFESIKGDLLERVRGDLYYLMKKKALNEFQIKIKYGVETVAIHYKVNPSGTIVNSNSPSGGIDYYEYPKNADINIILSRKIFNPEINKYMADRGWTGGGVFFVGTAENKGDYSKGNLSINRSIRK
ncbi:MAG: hypothetical protein AAFZ15_01370 [Bacteroidota bacterium]